MKVLIAWSHWGPYHHARFRAMRLAAADRHWDVVGLNIFGSSATYGWRVASDRDVVELQLGGREDAGLPLRSVWRAHLALRRLSPDIVMLPAYNRWSLWMNVLARLTHARVVIMSDTHEATARPGTLRRWARSVAVRSAHALFVAGAPHRRYFSSLGASHAKIVEGYDVVDNEFFTREASRGKRGAVDDERAELPSRYWLAVARLVPKKSLHTLIHAHAIARRELGRETPALVIIGQGPLRAALQRFADDLGTSEQIHFVETFSPQAVARAMGEADLFVLPSPSEEWGLVVNEAMAAGCPVIVTTGAGCQEDLIVPGTTGFTVAPDDPAALADKMVALHPASSTRARIAAGGSSRISEWGLTRFADGALEAVEKAMGFRLS